VRRRGDTLHSSASLRRVELNNDELALVVARLFELRITGLESDDVCAQIDDLAEKLPRGSQGDVLRAPAPDRFR
jgi:hypothetical protein